MTKFLDNSTYINIFQHISTIQHIVSLKFTYIALCKFSPFWLRFSPFWGNFLKDLFIWLITGWQVCILGRESDKYSYLLKPCKLYFLSFNLYISTKVMEGNDNLWTFLKSHSLCSGDLGKKSSFDLSKNHICTFL